MRVIQINKTNACQESAGLKWSVWNDIIPVGKEKYVVFNTWSRSSVLMEKDEVGVDIRTLPEDVVSILLSAGIIVNADVDEKLNFNKSFCAGKKDLTYVDLTILLTHNCQFDCKYCFEGGKTPVSIDNDVAENIISYLRTLCGICKKLRVTWFGGEPLLAYNAIKVISHELIAFCKENAIEYSADITTNGYALTEEKCAELVSKLQVKRYIITVDGPAEVHDKRRPLRNGLPTFKRIWGNIHDLVNSGASVTLRMTIDKGNSPYIHDFLDILAESALAGRVGLSFCRTVNYNFTPKEIQSQLYSEDEFKDVEWDCISYAHILGLWKYRFPHAAPRGGCLRDGDIVISATGEIYKCLDTIGDEQWKCGSIGMLAKGKSNDCGQWYREWQKWIPDDSPICASCVLMPLCSGGCPHNALFRAKMHGTESQCPDWKANYRKQIIEIAKDYE